MSETPQHEKYTPAKYVFGAFPLYEHKTPEFRETVGKVYVNYGDENNYPDYLIYLYNRSAIHNAIIGGKARFILGQGWQNKEVDPNLSQFIKRVNPTDTLDELTYKCILDRLIFGGYALRMIFMGGKLVSMYHQPFQEVRTNVDQSEFFVSKEWTRLQSTKAKFSASKRMPDDVRIIKPFDPNIRTGEMLLYITDYRPQQNIYPLPEYTPANAAIETDIEIDNFHLNNIKSGFAAGTMVTLFNGKPAPEEAKETERQLKAKFTGTDNAGELILNFAEVNEKEPTVTPLRSNELDKQYAQLKEDTIQSIFIGHNIPSPMLFGVKTEGQLGGRSEMDIAWKLLNLNYVDSRQRQMESDMNYLMSLAGYNSQLVLKPLKPLGVELSEETIKNSLTKDELRTIVLEQVGIEKQVMQQEADDLLTTLNSISPLVANKILNSLTKNQILSIIGLPPVEGGDVVPEDTPDTGANLNMSKEPLPADFDAILINKFSQIGFDRNEFASVQPKLTDDERALLDYIEGKKKLDIAKAKKALKIDVEKILKKLIEGNIVAANISGDVIEIKEIQLPEEEGPNVITLWEYAGPQDDKNRSLCAKLLSMNRLYSREQIDNLNVEMSAYLDESNYLGDKVDIWKYRGGWYTVPNTNGELHTPYCRHFWQQVVVRTNDPKAQERR